MENISTKEAIRRGLWIVNGPIAVVIFGSLFIALRFSNTHPLTSLSVTVAGFVLGWTYWSFAITRWKLWAYSHVENLVELKKAAVKAYLIWPDDSLFNKTEIKSAREAAVENQLLENAGASAVETRRPFYLTVRGLVVIFIIGLFLAVFAGAHH